MSTASRGYCSKSGSAWILGMMNLVGTLSFLHGIDSCLWAMEIEAGLGATLDALALIPVPAFHTGLCMTDGRRFDSASFTRPSPTGFRSALVSIDRRNVGTTTDFRRAGSAIILRCLDVFGRLRLKSLFSSTLEEPGGTFSFPPPDP